MEPTKPVDFWSDVNSPQELAYAADRRKSAEGWLGLFTALMILAALGTFGAQCLSWLKTGEWWTLRWSDVLMPLGDPEKLQWVGVRKIMGFFWSLPLATLPIVIVAICHPWINSQIQEGKRESAEYAAVQKRTKLKATKDRKKP